MTDILHRFQLENLHVRGEWLSLSQSWQEIQSTTDYPPAIRQVLGEALVAIGLLADSLKFDGSLVLQMRGAEIGADNGWISLDDVWRAVSNFFALVQYDDVI